MNDAVSLYLTNKCGGISSSIVSIKKVQSQRCSGWGRRDLYPNGPILNRAIVRPFFVSWLGKRPLFFWSGQEYRTGILLAPQNFGPFQWAFTLVIATELLAKWEQFFFCFLTHWGH
jgi:hypothetical protein